MESTQLNEPYQFSALCDCAERNIRFGRIAIEPAVKRGWLMVAGAICNEGWQIRVVHN